MADSDTLQAQIIELHQRFKTALAGEGEPDAFFTVMPGAAANPESLDQIARDVDAQLQQWPNQAGLLLLKGHLTAQQSAFGQAAQYYEAAINGAQDSVTDNGYECLFHLGVARYHQGDFAAAAIALSRCAEQRADGYYERVNQFYNMANMPLNTNGKSFEYTSRLYQATVRVFSHNMRGRGTGFALANEKIILTCAHVVGQINPATKPLITVDIPHQKRRIKTLLIAIDHNVDIAVLYYEHQLPHGLKLRPSVSSQKQSVYTYGFAWYDGIWAHGQVVALTPPDKPAVIQIKSGEISPGFSGGPVWELGSEKVIGMITDISIPNGYARFLDTALAVSSEKIIEFLENSAAVQKIRGSGCWIAGAAFNNADDPVVRQLRHFRDEKLITSRGGRWFIRHYYRYSPPLAGFIRRHDLIKSVVRGVLRQLVKRLI